MSIVALGLASSMIMFVALGLASTSDDNSKFFFRCGKLIVALGAWRLALPAAWVNNSKGSVLVEYPMRVAMCRAQN